MKNPHRINFFVDTVQYKNRSSVIISFERHLLSINFEKLFTD